MEKVIIGAPQYFIGNYLSDDTHHKHLEQLLGCADDKSVLKLNNFVRDLIFRCDKKPIIFLHYSRNDHTYCEHVSYLIDDLKRNNYDIYFDVRDYTNHSDVAFWFKDFLKQSI